MTQTAETTETTETDVAIPTGKEVIPRGPITQY